MAGPEVMQYQFIIPVQGRQQPLPAMRPPSALL